MLGVANIDKANVDKVVADVVVGCVASVMGSSCKCDVWCGSVDEEQQQCWAV